MLVATSQLKAHGIPGTEIRGTTGRPCYLTSEEVMGILRYEDRAAFWEAVHRDGIPCMMQNKRRGLFPVAEFHAWLDRKTTSHPSFVR